MGKEDYKNEKKGHGFLCVPKELLFDNRYKQLTIEAILLYAYMLDRLKLSIENGWKDSDGKVFIYFSLESIMDLLKCSKGKAISTLKELDRVPLTEIATTSYGTQLSVINYSQPIDGKPAIILSAPNATNGRKNGKIWIGLINETGQSGVNKYSVEWKYCYSVDTPQMGYSYSCLTELPDGKVGLLYEKYDSWSRNELHLKNILKYEKFTIDELKVQP